MLFQGFTGTLLKLVVVCGNLGFRHLQNHLQLSNNRWLEHRAADVDYCLVKRASQPRTFISWVDPSFHGSIRVLDIAPLTKSGGILCDGRNGWGVNQKGCRFEFYLRSQIYSL